MRAKQKARIDQMVIRTNAKFELNHLIDAGQAKGPRRSNGKSIKAVRTMVTRTNGQVRIKSFDRRGPSKRPASIKWEIDQGCTYVRTYSYSYANEEGVSQFEARCRLFSSLNFFYCIFCLKKSRRDVKNKKNGVTHHGESDVR